TAINRSLRSVSPSSVCSASITPIKRQGTTHPVNVGSSMMIRMSSGSPSAAFVLGTNPNACGNTMPSGSTPDSEKNPIFSSYLNLLRLPPGVSITASTTPRSLRPNGFSRVGFEVFLFLAFATILLPTLLEKRNAKTVVNNLFAMLRSHRLDELSRYRPTTKYSEYRMSGPEVARYNAQKNRRTYEQRLSKI